MSGDGFDAVVTALARARSRRAWGVALAAATIGSVPGDAVSAGAGQTTLAQQCRGKRSKCRRNGHCCSGRCRKPNGKKKGRCRCSRYLQPCRTDGDCCPLDGAPLVCASGTCQT